MLELRLLDPLTDHLLYEEAYGWRPEPKAHLQPDRLPFEVFASDDPRHITMGLFNGQFLGLYFLHEIEPRIFQVHMTSRRKASRESLLLGAQEVVRLFFENGASELVAWIKPRNRPLRQFVEALAFTPKRKSELCGTHLDEANAYIEYVLQG
jgi:hypothetical protein